MAQVTIVAFIANLVACRTYLNAQRNFSVFVVVLHAPTSRQLIPSLFVLNQRLILSALFILYNPKCHLSLRVKVQIDPSVIFYDFIV